jgi:hypothetical protein
MDESGAPMGLFPSAIVANEETFLDPARVLRTLRRYGSWIMGNATIYNAAMLKACGGFSQGLESYSDSFIADLMALMNGACFIPKPLVVWRRMSSGYSASISGQVDRRLLLIQKIETLMTATYSQYFHRDYVQLWKRRQLFLFLHDRVAAQRISSDELTLIKARLPRLTFLDQLFFKLMGWKYPPKVILTRLHAFLGHTRYQKWDTLRRRLFPTL